MVSYLFYLLFGSKSLVGVVVGGVLIAIAAIHVLTTELALTNRRIIAKSGLIRRNTIELKTNRVESLGVNQGILEEFSTLVLLLLKVLVDHMHQFHI